MIGLPYAHCFICVVHGGGECGVERGLVVGVEGREIYYILPKIIIHFEMILR